MTVNGMHRQLLKTFLQKYFHTQKSILYCCIFTFHILLLLFLFDEVFGAPGLLQFVEVITNFFGFFLYKCNLSVITVNEITFLFTSWSLIGLDPQGRTMQQICE